MQMKDILNNGEAIKSLPQINFILIYKRYINILFI